MDLLREDRRSRPTNPHDPRAAADAGPNLSGVNTERLHAIANAVEAEISAGSLTAVQELVTALRQAAQDPGHQPAVSSLREQLGSQLRAAPSNGFSPAWREALTELGIADLLGESLLERVEEIFQRNEITLNTAADELQPYAERLAGLNEALERISGGFDYFQIGAEELAAGEFEVGFLIPREAVDADIGELGDEFVKIKRILGPFLELSTGTRPEIRVRSLSSSEFQVFLDSLPATALLLATTIERIISAYEKVMNIRLARQQLADAGASESTLRSVTEEADTKMAAEIEEFVEELLEQADSLETGRANELRKELKDSLNSLANRIDRGYSLEVRAGELPQPEEEPEGATADTQTELRETVAAVRAAQERIKFAELSGKPILELPEAEDKATPGTQGG